MIIFHPNGYLNGIGGKYKRTEFVRTQLHATDYSIRHLHRHATWRLDLHDDRQLDSLRCQLRHRLPAARPDPTRPEATSSSLRADVQIALESDTRRDSLLAQSAVISSERHRHYGRRCLSSDDVSYVHVVSPSLFLDRSELRGFGNADRGQRLNDAIHNVAFMVQKTKEHGCTPAIISAYQEEMLPRAR